MQQSWRNDHDKLTFIACLPISGSAEEVVAGEHDKTERMIGDVNLFLSPADEDEEGCVGEYVNNFLEVIFLDLSMTIWLFEKFPAV